jgi:hypothetical protein
MHVYSASFGVYYLCYLYLYQGIQSITHGWSSDEHFILSGSTLLLVASLSFTTYRTYETSLYLLYHIMIHHTYCSPARLLHYTCLPPKSPPLPCWATPVPVARSCETMSSSIFHRTICPLEAWARVDGATTTAPTALKRFRTSGPLTINPVTGCLTLEE